MEVTRSFPLQNVNCSRKQRHSDQAAMALLLLLKCQQLCGVKCGDLCKSVKSNADCRESLYLSDIRGARAKKKGEDFWAIRADIASAIAHIQEMI